MIFCYTELLFTGHSEPDRTLSFLLKQVVQSVQKNCLQSHHGYFTLKRHGNNRLHVALTRNARDVFPGSLQKQSDKNSQNDKRSIPKSNNISERKNFNFFCKFVLLSVTLCLFPLFSVFSLGCFCCANKAAQHEADQKKKIWWLYLFNIIIKQKLDMKEQHKQSAMYIAYYKQRVSKNVMPTQIVPTIEIYQSDFPNLIILKRPANVVISSSLLLSLCSLCKAHYQQRVGEKAMVKHCIRSINKSYN